MSTNDQSYVAFAFHPDLGNRVVQGIITIDPFTLRFVCEEGKVEIGLDVVRVNTEEEGRVFFSDPNRPEWKIYTTEMEILDHPVFEKRHNLKQQVAPEPDQTKGLFKLTAVSGIFVAAFVLVVVALLWCGGFAARAIIVQSVPLSFDSELGEHIMEEIEAEGKLVKDPKTEAYLKDMAQKILPKEEWDRFNFQFHVVSNDFPNAFAAAGGNVFVTTGTMNLIDDPDQLAGILAHELSHVTLRHAVRSQVTKYSAFAAFAVLAGGRSAFLKAVSAGSGILLVQGFSQEHEAEADEQGWDYLVAAHIDPRGLPNSLKRIDAETERLLQAKYKDLASNLKIPQVLSDHPPTGTRVTHLEKNGGSSKTSMGLLNCQNWRSRGWGLRTNRAAPWALKRYFL